GTRSEAWRRRSAAVDQRDRADDQAGGRPPRRRRPPAPGLAFAGRLLVDAAAEHAAGCDLRQQRVGVAFLVEGLVEERRRVVVAELARERPGRAVTGDLVVLDALRCCDEGRVLRDRITRRLDDLVAFLD